MTSKESVLLQLMQEEGYSVGTINITLHMLGGDKVKLDEMILLIDDEHPKEDLFIERLAEVGRT